jgi:hypothetical protein
MAIASLVIALAALVLSARAAREARRARKSTEDLLERTLARTTAMTRRPWQEGDVIPSWGDRPLSAGEAESLNEEIQRSLWR